MKKYIAIALIIITVITAIILFTRKDNTEDTSPTSEKAVTVNIEPEITKKSKNKNYDKTITVTLPIDFIEEEHRNNLENYAKANGYFSIDKLGEEHVRIKMREYSYRLILTAEGMKTMTGIGTAMDCGDYPYFLGLPKYNDDFSYIVIAVDKEGYLKAKNTDELFEYLAFFCLSYQLYSQESKGKCEIVVCEKDTNVLIESREFTNKDVF